MKCCFELWSNPLKTTDFSPFCRNYNPLDAYTSNHFFHPVHTIHFIFWIHWFQFVKFLTLNWSNQFYFVLFYIFIFKCVISCKVHDPFSLILTVSFSFSLFSFTYTLFHNILLTSTSFGFGLSYLSFSSSAVNMIQS